MELHSEIKGLAEIDEFLATLALKVQRNVLRGALRAGAKELEAAAKAELASNNSVKTGALRDSIKASVRVKRGVPTATIRAGSKEAYYAHMVEFGTVAHLISVKDGPTRLLRSGKTKQISVRTLNRAIKRGSLRIGNKLIGVTVEHPGAQKKPFMRPALDKGTPAALRAFRTYLYKRLNKVGLNTPAPESD